MTKFTQMAVNEDDGTGRRRIHLREISGDSDAPLETVGQDLRAARIRRGDDLAAVSRNLKIRKDHLDALESDRMDELPGKTYAIGFVRSYARYLGLDSAQLTERFKAEISGRGDDHPLPMSNLHEDESRRLPYGWRILGGVIAVALLYGIWHIFFAAREAPQTVPPPPTLARITEAPRTQAPRPAVIGAPGESAPRAAVTAAPPPTATATVATATAAVPPQSGQATAQTLGQPGSRIVLRIRAPTVVTITGPDRRQYINRRLEAGSVYYVPNLNGLRLDLSNAGAVQVDLDGAALGRVGGDGLAVGGVSLDPQALADRFNGGR